jgi:DNA-directed RNA polymerase subunit RPC12/RpoP
MTTIYLEQRCLECGKQGLQITEDGAVTCFECGNSFIDKLLAKRIWGK